MTNTVTPLPSHDRLFFINWKPFLHLQSKEPTLFSQVCSHGPGVAAHSFTSRNRNRWYLLKFQRIFLSYRSSVKNVYQMCYWTVLSRQDYQQRSEYLIRQTLSGEICVGRDYSQVKFLSPNEKFVTFSRQKVSHNKSESVTS